MPCAAAGAPAAGEILIRNLGEGHIEESFVRAQISVRVGSEFSRAKVSRDVQALLNTGRFSYVGVRGEKLEDGLRLVYSLRNKLRLAAPLTILGAENMRDAKVRELLGVKPGDYFDDQALGLGARKVIEAYHKDYYPEVDVAWDIELVRPGEVPATVTVRITENRRARVRRIAFSGNDHVPLGVLKKVAQRHVWWSPMRWFYRRRYDPDEIEGIRLAVREIYLDRGYHDVELGRPRIERDRDGHLSVTYVIREGDILRFGDVALEGVTLFPEAELRRRIGPLRGQPASHRVMRQTAQALRDYYGSRGYMDTRVQTIRDPDPALGLLSVRFKITEGALTRIRNVNIRGNTRTRDKVVRRELLVLPGDVYDEVRIRRSERRAANLGFFSSVRSRSESTSVPDERDLVFEVEEKRTGQFMVGAGFSSVDSVMGFVELSQGNFDLRNWPHFTGGGQKMKVRAEFGSRREEYELSFVEPWFLERKLKLGFDLYRTDVSYDYDVERTGVAISIGKPLPWGNSINLGYRLENVVIFDIDETDEYIIVDTGESYYFTSEEDKYESSMRVTLTHDARDNPFIPTRGTRAVLHGTLMGGPFGFDTDVYSVGVRARHYFRLWFGHVLSFRGRYEVVKEYGDTDEAPIANRLFLGGGRTLRGFDHRDVGPKAVRADDPTGDLGYRALGGRSLALAGAEYTVPVVEGIRLAVFCDVGNVWWEDYALDLNDLASSAGVGLRFDLPGFPIRIDRAWVIESDDGLTEEDPWAFWIGHDF